MWQIICILICVGNLWAQPQYGPLTLVAEVPGHTISSPRITHSLVYWVDEAADFSAVKVASLSEDGIISDAMEIAHCTAQSRLVIEAVYTSIAVISLRHNDSFDLFLVEIDENSEIDSTLIISETAGFEEGFGVLPNYPEEASITLTDYAWAVTWATAMLTSVTHEWRSLAHFAIQTQWNGLIVLPLGNLILSELYSTPRAVHAGSDTLKLFAAGERGDSLAYLRFGYDGGSNLHEEDWWPCVQNVRGIFSHNYYQVVFVEDNPNELGRFYLANTFMFDSCAVVAETGFPRGFDRISTKWGWGFAGVTIMNDELWIESADESGGTTLRARPLHTTSNGAVNREADIFINSAGYIETLWTESPDNASNANVLKWASVFYWDILNSPEAPALPDEFALSTYPNPFNSTVRIDYELPRASDVQVSIFNTLGEEVATLFDGRANAGSHTLSWSPNSASGVYFVKLEAATFVKTQKLLYIQ